MYSLCALLFVFSIYCLGISALELNSAIRIQNVDIPQHFFEKRQVFNLIELPIIPGGSVGAPPTDGSLRIIAMKRGIVGVFNATQGFTHVRLFVDGGDFGGHALQVRVRYDFDGNGVFDRIEIWDEFFVDTNPDMFESTFSQYQAPDQVFGSDYLPMTNGDMIVDTWQSTGNETNIKIRTGFDVPNEVSLVIEPYMDPLDTTTEVTTLPTTTNANVQTTAPAVATTAVPSSAALPSTQTPPASTAASSGTTGTTQQSGDTTQAATQGGTTAQNTGAPTTQAATQASTQAPATQTNPATPSTVPPSTTGIPPPTTTGATTGGSTTGTTSTTGGSTTGATNPPATTTTSGGEPQEPPGGGGSSDNSGIIIAIIILLLCCCCLVLCVAFMVVRKKNAPEQPPPAAQDPANQRWDIETIKELLAAED